MYKEDYEVVGIILLMIVSVISLILLVFLIHLPLQGSHVGYITAVDEDWLCTNIYIKTDVQSSQEDLYAIPKGDLSIKGELEEALRKGVRTEIVYENNNWSFCGRRIIEVRVISGIN